MDVTGSAALADLADLVERSADPPAVRTALDRLGAAAVERVVASPSWPRRSLRWWRPAAAPAADRRRPAALDVLVARQHRRGGTGSAGTGGDGPDGAGPAGGAVGARGPGGIRVADAADGDRLAGAKRLAQLRIMALDLLGRATLEQTTAALADLAAAVLDRRSAWRRRAPRAWPSSAWASWAAAAQLRQRRRRDVRRRRRPPGPRRDGPGPPLLPGRRQPAARGRDGALTRSVESYRSYWQRWAQPWEFQALLKAVPVAGDPQVGRSGPTPPAALWARRLTADDLQSLRALKSPRPRWRSREPPSREVKRGRGGIRDIEFAVQTLQLVHGRPTPSCARPTRSPPWPRWTRPATWPTTTPPTWRARYRFLRRVEHALQIEDERQTHTLPAERDHRRIARVLGYRGTPEAGATEAFDHDLVRQRNLVRRVHERLYFRPLLDSLAGAGRLSPETAADALATFGFTDVERTRAAVRELTRGLTRSSRMMQQLLPLVLDWLDLARSRSRPARAAQAGVGRATDDGAGARVPRPAQMMAMRLCDLLGTSALLGDILVANPDLTVRLATPERLGRSTVPTWSLRPPPPWPGGRRASGSGRCTVGGTATCWASPPATCSARRTSRRWATT